MSRSKAAILLYALAVLAVGASVRAAAPDVDWQKLYGDTLVDIGYWIEEHSSYGFLVSGYMDRDTSGYHDAFLMRLDDDGDTLWLKTYGGSLQSAGMCVREASEGGYILSGYFERIPGDYDGWFVRTDSNGDTLWTSNFDFGDDEFLYCVEETDDGGFVAAGFTSSIASPGSTDVLVLKVDSDGRGDWKDVHGGIGHNRGYDMCRTSDGNYVVVGYTEVGADRGDVLILKIDGTDGDSLWAKTYGDTTVETARSVKETSDGGLIVGGTRSNSASNWIKGHLIRTDADGDSVWTRDYGSTSEYTSIASLAITPDLGYICAGYRDTARAGDADFLFLKTDAGGDTLWTKMVGDGARELARSLTPTRDLGYAAVGYRRKVPAYDINIYIVKLGADEAGAGPVEEQCVPGFMAVESVNPFTHSVSVRYEIPVTAHVGLAVYDISGRHVVTLAGGVMNAGSHRVDWDCRDADGNRVPSGVYFIRGDAAGLSDVEKLIILR